MTVELNSEGNHLSSANPSLWVTRKHGAIMSYHQTSRQAVRWLRDNADSPLGWKVTKSYGFTVRYWDRSFKPERAFPAETASEHETFADAMDEVGAWIHSSWEYDRSNHPSPAGRQAAWERWHDVLALSHIAALTLISNPGFSYAFGNLSPPEGRGHDLRIRVAPSSESVLHSAVERNLR